MVERNPDPVDALKTSEELIADSNRQGVEPAWDSNEFYVGSEYRHTDDLATCRLNPLTQSRARKLRNQFNWDYEVSVEARVNECISFPALPPIMKRIASDGYRARAVNERRASLSPPEPQPDATRSCGFQNHPVPAARLKGRLDRGWSYRRQRWQRTRQHVLALVAAQNAHRGGHPALHAPGAISRLVRGSFTPTPAVAAWTFLSHCVFRLRARHS